MVGHRFLVVIAWGLLGLLAAAPARADVVDDAPAIVARGVGEMRAFIRGSDGALWTRTWDGASWTSWTSLGGSLSSGPAASVRPDGIYDVVVRGADGGYHFRAFTPAGGWTDWSPLGGKFISAPGVSYRQGTGQIDVVGVGTDRQLQFQAYEPGAGWTGWSTLGGSVSGTPSIISPMPQSLDIYVRGADGQLFQKFWTASTGWSAFIPLGGSLFPGVAATAWDSTRRDIFARATDGRMWIRSWTSAGSWAPWALLGGTPTSGPGASSPGPNRLIVLTRAGTKVASNSFLSTWSGWQDFGFAPIYTPPPPPAPPPPVAVPTPGSSIELRAGFGCIPQGGRVPIRVRIKARTDRLKPRVIKVVFFIDGGKRRRVDRHKPYKTRIRVTFKRGTKHRAHARIYFRRKGQRRIQRKTVSKRFTMCR